FFDRYADGRLQVDSWDSLLAILTVMTLRKCGHRIEYFGAACRDVRREGRGGPDGSDAGSDWEVVARDPTPAEAAMLTELVEQLMASLPERERPVLVLTLQGYTPAEIGEQIGRTERTVYRVLDRIKQKLADLRSSS